ncbi:hypothetical protein PF008_g142 [Phytophthora fragariae]|uniref:Integrase zinc-binding domain-containing protein n=1 Tax=Phytophthora fragariae TaxID=53985 RepID=A0A6G0SP63_9STRA|nr:hypothetical protein PF008_g142 [Phytophthora fragariae]
MAWTVMSKYLRIPFDTARRQLSARSRARIDRYQPEGNLLTYSVDRADPPRMVFPPGDDLRERLIHELNNLGREKTFASLSRDFYWLHIYK